MKKTYLNPTAEFDTFQTFDVMNASSLGKTDGADIDVGGRLLPDVLSVGGNPL